MAESERQEVVIDGRTLSVSNLHKVLYPSGFTKAAVIDYYVKIAPVLLPHLAGRPLTMIRFPDGVGGNSFFEKRCPDHRPEWLDTVRLGRPEGRTKVVDHCDVDSVAGLVWVANLASLELHTSLARRPDTDIPTMVVFDLDPGAPADVVTCCTVALQLREVFDRLGLDAVAKTSGSKGMQVYVPINTPTDYGATKDFALSVGQLLERVHPELVTTTMAKVERPGRIFVDWSQNVLTKTTVCAYSLRARDEPTVSTPVTWDEVSDCASGDLPPLRFTAPEVLARVADLGDLFAMTSTVEQELPDLG